MASRFFAILDDVAGAAKIATRKTAGLLGDDLAVNAEKATDFLALIKASGNAKVIAVIWKHWISAHTTRAILTSKADQSGINKNRLLIPGVCERINL